MAPESIAAGNDLNVFFGAVYCEMMHSELVVVGSRDSLLCSRNVTRFLVSVERLECLVLSIERGKSLCLILCTKCDVGLHEGNSGEDNVVTELQRKTSCNSR